VSSHILDVNRGGDDFNIVEGELRALGDNLPVQCDYGGAIVVKSVSIAALLICIQIDTPELANVDTSRQTWGVRWEAQSHFLCGFPYEVYSSVEFP
jgi:hypothetical protein